MLLQLWIQLERRTVRNILRSIIINIELIGFLEYQLQVGISRYLLVIATILIILDI